MGITPKLRCSSYDTRLKFRCMGSNAICHPLFHLRPFPMRNSACAELCLRGALFGQGGCKQSLFCFQCRFCPVKRGNLTGSSRNEVGYSERGICVPRPVSRLLRVAVAIMLYFWTTNIYEIRVLIAHFSMLLKQKLIKQSPYFVQLQLCYLSGKKKLSRKRNKRLVPSSHLIVER